MRFIHLLVFCVATIEILALDNTASDGKINLPPSPQPEPTIVPQPSTNVTIPTSSTTTTKPTTPITSTTTKPTTPSTTTTKSTTPSTTPTTTTKPTTPTPSTTVKPSPTPKPAPVPPPKAGNWSVIDPKTNRTCLIVNMAVQLEVNQFNNTNATLLFNIPPNLNITGSCSLNETIEFDVLTPATNVSSAKFSFIFGKLNNTKQYALGRVDVTLNVTSLGQNQNWTLQNFTHEAAEFPTPLDNSYKCTPVEYIKLAGPTKAVLHLSEVQWQAFANSTDKKFSSALDCEGSQTPDVVPIAVGCVLVALIVLVLVGYLFGRRRCQARGYLSM